MNYGVLREVRRSRRIKQYELADRVGISQSYLSLIEQGKSNPSIEILERMCVLLGLELRILVR